jgi:hypothetical protein
MARNTGPQLHPGNAAGQGIGAGNEATAKAKRVIWRPYEAGMGCCAGNGYPGEHPSGMHRPDPEGPGGAAFGPESPYDDEERAPRRMPRRSISGKY